MQNDKQSTIKNTIRWVSICLIGILITLMPAPDLGREPEERFFQIEASRFAYNPGTIRVNPGDLVTIEVIAQDVVHGLTIDDYRVAMTVDPGQPQRVTFVAEHSGVYRMRCSATCGEMHPFMIGKFQVGPNLLYFRGLGLAILALVMLVWRRTS